MTRSSASILIIDDEPDMLSMLFYVLSSSGFEVVTKGSGEAALLELQERDFDLVVTDYNMPGMNGLQTLAGIRALRPKIKVIMTSGYVTAEIKEVFFENGVFGFIQKPFSLKKFRDVVQRAVGVVQ